MNSENLKNRIEQRLKTLKMSKVGLAEEINVSRQMLGNWISRGNIPTTHVFEVANALKCDPEWLAIGRLSSIDNETVPANMPINDIPIVSWVMAGSTHTAELLDHVKDYTSTTRKHSPSTYALKVIGDSMTNPNAPHSFPEGSTIIVDPEQKGDTTDGIFVIAKENGIDAVTFKQLKYDGATPYLNPLNPSHPKIFKEFRIIGKVIDAHLPPLP